MPRAAEYSASAAAAGPARTGIDRPFTAAGGAGLGELHESPALLHASRAHAGRTGPARSAGLGPRPVAGRTGGIALQINLHGLSEDRVLQVNLDRIGDVLAFYGPTRSCLAPEYVSENVLEPAAPEELRALREPLEPLPRARTLSKSLIKGGMPELVILLLLLRIGKDLVRFVHFLELLLRSLVAGINVRMILSRKLPERLFDLGLGCSLLNTQDIVIISFCR